MIEFDRINGSLRLDRPQNASVSRGGERGAGSVARSDSTAGDGRAPTAIANLRVAAVGGDATRIVDIARGSALERLRGAASDARSGESGENETAGDAREDVQSVLNELLEEVMGDGFIDRELRISIDEESDRFVYKTVDIESGEVLHQFPPEDLLRIVASIREVAGLILDQDA